MSRQRFIIQFLALWIITYAVGQLKIVVAVAEVASGNAVKWGEPASSVEPRWMAVFVILYSVCYGLMALTTFKWGERIQRGWLHWLPIAAGISDAIFGIFFLPTALCAITFLISLLGDESALTESAPSLPDPIYKRHTQEDRTTTPPARTLNTPPSVRNLTKSITQNNAEKSQEFNGEKDLGNDLYKIFLTEKYNVKKNDLFNKFVWNGKMYEDLAHLVEILHDEELSADSKRAVAEEHERKEQAQQQELVRGVIFKISSQGYFVYMIGDPRQRIWEVRKDFYKRAQIGSANGLIDFYLSLEGEDANTLRKLAQHNYQLLGYDINRSLWIISNPKDFSPIEVEENGLLELLARAEQSRN